MKAIGWTLAVAVGAAVIAGPVVAGSCGPVKEYAQYKDKARTAQGRDSLAVDFCLSSRLHTLYGDQGRIRDMEECSAVTSKIMDALSAANDQRAIKRALGGCPDVFDKKNDKQS